MNRWMEIFDFCGFIVAVSKKKAPKIGRPLSQLSLSLPLFSPLTSTTTRMYHHTSTPINISAGGSQASGLTANKKLLPSTSPPNAPKSGKKKKKNAPLSFFATLATNSTNLTSKIAALTFVPKLGHHSPSLAR
jgi:hypothetical protein